MMSLPRSWSLKCSTAASTASVWYERRDFFTRVSLSGTSASLNQSTSSWSRSGGPSRMTGGFWRLISADAFEVQTYAVDIQSLWTKRVSLPSTMNDLPEAARNESSAGLSMRVSGLKHLHWTAQYSPRWVRATMSMPMSWPPNWSRYGKSFQSRTSAKLYVGCVVR